MNWASKETTTLKSDSIKQKKNQINHAWFSGIFVDQFKKKSINVKICI